MWYLMYVYHLELSSKTNHLIENNFIQRMLFLDSY